MLSIQSNNTPHKSIVDISKETNRLKGRIEREKKQLKRHSHQERNHMHTCISNCIFQIIVQIYKIHVCWEIYIYILHWGICANARRACVCQISISQLLICKVQSMEEILQYQSPSQPCRTAVSFAVQAENRQAYAKGNQNANDHEQRACKKQKKLFSNDGKTRNDRDDDRDRCGSLRGRPQTIAQHFIQSQTNEHNGATIFHSIYICATIQLHVSMNAQPKFILNAITITLYFVHNIIQSFALQRDLYVCIFGCFFLCVFSSGGWWV